jgi:nitrogen fixation NifU-like protein
MSDLTQLYQEIILSHNKHPKNYRVPDDISGRAELNNPLCGDEVEVFWKLKGGLIEDLAFQSRGCAISRASASIMTELLQGKSITEARALFTEFSQFLGEADPNAAMGKQLGDLKALSGVKAYPSRIKCATLAWHALLDNACAV